MYDSKVENWVVFTVGDVVASVFNTSFKSNLKVYPNPATDFVLIESNDAEVIIEVYNLTGAKLNISVIDDVINVSGLPSGVYFVKQDANFRKLVKK